MARKIRKDASLAGLLKRAAIDPKVLKTSSGRKVRKDAKVNTLRKRSK
ncbi:MAG TPA: hypothetical protein P5150_09050 [Candidatus Ratteibacteria bacterium]|nr:hypothetical protein [bacterium]HRR96857.1 hypothetical protein [Candidatus Ratteibacteria bacterium]